MKNVKVYIGTIKKCLDPDGYEKYGDKRTVEVVETKSKTIIETFAWTKHYTKLENEQAIIIKNEFNRYYEFKLTNNFEDNLRIIFDDIDSAIKVKPKEKNDLFIEEADLIPYYYEQPKRLSLRKLKKDLLNDPRIKTEIAQMKR